MAMQQVSDKNTFKTLFYKVLEFSNVSNNSCEKVREVFRLCEKFGYFFFFLKIRNGKEYKKLFTSVC